eukprot:5630151-Prymnesium_polylepis.1
MSSDGSLSSSSEFVVVDMSVAAEHVLGWKWFLGGLKRAALRVQVGAHVIEKGKLRKPPSKAVDLSHK